MKKSEIIFLVIFGLINLCYLIFFTDFFLSLIIFDFIAIWSIDSHEKNNREKDPIRLVKYQGLRRTTVTNESGTHTIFIYIFLVIYKNGKREIIECDCKSEQFKELCNHIKLKKPSKNSKPLTIEEMIFFDEIND